MEVGETVVLVNSSPIHSCFYDVFNRHFAIIAIGAVDDKKEDDGKKGKEPSEDDLDHQPKDEQMYKCYANLAVGSYSRPCVVHKDFKIIVHTPASALSTTPLPLLNRFEKYPISLEQALYQKLRLGQWEEIFVNSESGVKAVPIYDVIKEGCNDMVDKLHVLQSQSRLFYGLVPNETVASLMLSFVDRSLQLRSQIPEIPPSFKSSHVGLRALLEKEDKPKKVDRKGKGKAPEQEDEPHDDEPREDEQDEEEEEEPSPKFGFQYYVGDEEEEEVIMGDINANPTERILEFVRQANFHLLQLARPEHMFFCRQFPGAYMSEYLINQEHLSLIRFMHHVFIRQFFEAGHLQKNKWCIFTRTSGELLRLHTDAKLKELLVLPLMEKDAMLDDEDNLDFEQPNLGEEQEDDDERISTMADKRMRVVSLHSLASTTACARLVKNFAKSKTRRILIFVADMSVCTQSQVNVCRNNIDSLLPNSSRQMALVILHFPPEMGFSSRPCYHAIFLNNWDFIYIDSLGVTTGTATEDEKLRKEVNVDGEVQDEEDEKPVLEVDAKTWIAKGFGLKVNISPQSVTKAFSSLFFQLLEQCCNDMNAYGGQQLQHSRLFYFGNARNRFSTLQKVFDKFPFMLDDILTNFGNLWSLSLLNTVVADACKALQKGQALGSLLQLIYSSLRFLLAPFVLQVTKMLCSNYSLEPIMSIKTENPSPDDKQHSSLLHIILRTVSPPPLIDILKLNVETTISLARQFPTPPRLAMYDLISDQLLKLLDSAVKRLANKIITHDLLDEEFSELAEKDNLYPAIQFIDNSAFLSRLFKEDFVTRTLQMSAMKSKALEMTVELLDGLCYARGNKLGVLRLYIVKYFDEAKMTYLNVCLRPLLNLQDPPNLKAMLPPRDQIGKMMSTAKDADAFILQLTVKVLWERLDGILRGKFEDESVDMLDNWSEVFCALRARLKYRRTLALLLSVNELFWYDLQTCVFLYRLNFNVSAADTLANVNSQHVKEAWKAVASQKVQRDSYRGLEGVLHLVSSLFAAAKDKASPEQATHFVQDVLYYFLHDDEAPSAQDGTLFAITLNDISTFARLCTSELPLAGFKEQWDLLWKHVPFSWKVWTIHDLVHNKRPGWVGMVQNSIAETIHNFVKMEDYNYTPRLLDKRHLPEPARQTCALEEALFYVTLREVECEAKEDKADLLRLCQLYSEIKFDNIDVKQRILRCMRQVSLATLILSAVAAVMGNPATDLEKLVDTWPKEISDTVVLLLAPPVAGNPTGAPAAADVFLLQSVSPHQQLLKVLKSNTLLTKLTIPKWFVNDNIPVQNYFMFSFMIETQTALGKQYAAFKALVQAGAEPPILAHLNAELAKAGPENELDSIRGHYRMFLILISYYHFYADSKACAVLQNLYNQKGAGTLEALLDINPTEMVAFQKLAAGPIHVPDDIDALLYLFSIEAQQQKADLTLVHIMVNSLAVCLGAPRDSNHIYLRAFDVGKLHKTFGPGSAYQRQNYDCGFQLTAGQLQNADIMGNHARFRFALNAMVWAAISWCCVIDPVNGTKACLSNYHFLNYWQQDGAFKKAGARDRTDPEKVKYYIMARASTFFEHLNHHPEMHAQHMDGMHFMTESLFRLWTVIDNDHKPSARNPALRALYKTEAEAKAYEDVMKAQVFDVVYANYNELKKVYQQAAVPVANINLITSVQDSQAVRFLSPLVAFDAFRDYMANRETNKANRPQAAVDHKLLPYFLQERVRLRALQFLPVVVHFYKLITTTLSHRVTEQQAMELTVPQCIELIRAMDKLRRTDLAESLTKHWQEFQAAWAQIRDLLAELEGCPDQQRNRQFESYITIVDKDTLLGTLISHPNVLDVHDEIFRVINELVKKQNSMLQKREHYEKWNEHKLIFEDRAAELYLSHLPTDSDKQEILVTGNYNQLEFEQFIMSYVGLDENFSRQNIGFDVHRIKRQVLEQFLCGKSLLDTKNFRQPFAFKIAEEIPKEQKKNAPVAEEGAELLMQHLGIRPLRRVMKEMSHGPYARELDDQQRQQVLTALKQKGEKDLLGAADLLRKLIEQIISRDPFHGAEHDPKRKNKDDIHAKYDKMTIKEAVAEWLNTNNPSLANKKPIHELRLAHIVPISAIVAQKYLEKDYLFSAIKPTISEPLSSNAQKHLQALEASLLSRTTPVENAKRWLTLLDSISTELLKADVLTQAHAARGPGLRQSLYAKFEAKFVAVANNIGFQIDDVKQIAPETVLISQFGSYIRFLHLLSGNLLMKTTPVASEKAKAAVKLYQERVPEEVTAAQQPVSAEPVQEPMDLLAELHQVADEPQVEDPEPALPQLTIPLPPLAGGDWWEEQFTKDPLLVNTPFAPIDTHGIPPIPFEINFNTPFSAPELNFPTPFSAPELNFPTPAVINPFGYPSATPSSVASSSGTKSSEQSTPTIPPSSDEYLVRSPHDVGSPFATSPHMPHPETSPIPFPSPSISPVLSPPVASPTPVRLNPLPEPSTSLPIQHPTAQHPPQSPSQLPPQSPTQLPPQSPTQVLPQSPISQRPTPDTTSPPTTLSQSSLLSSSLISSTSSLSPGAKASGRGPLMLVKLTHAGAPVNFKEFRSSPISTIYARTAEKVKLAVTAFLLQHGDNVLDAEGAAAIGDLTPNPAVELVVRTDLIALTVSFGAEIWNTSVLRTTTGASVYRKVAQKFQLEPSSFAIEVLLRSLPDTEVALEDQFPPNCKALTLSVSTGPSVVIVLPEGTLTFQVAADSSLLELYSKVSQKLQQYYEQFYFSLADSILIAHDSDIQVKHLLAEGTNQLKLQFVHTSSIVPISLTGPDGSKMLLGFPPATPTETVYRKIDQLYPNCVLFHNDQAWIMDNDQPKTAGEMRPAESKQIVNIMAVPRESTISLALVVDGAEFNLTVLDSMALHDVFGVAVKDFDAVILKGGDGAEIEPGSAELESSVGDYRQLAIELGMDKDTKLVFLAEPKAVPAPVEKPVNVRVTVGGQELEVPILEKDIDVVNIITAVAAEHPEVSVASHAMATSKGLILQEAVATYAKSGDSVNIVKNAEVAKIKVHAGTKVHELAFVAATPSSNFAEVLSQLELLDPAAFALVSISGIWLSGCTLAQQLFMEGAVLEVAIVEKSETLQKQFLFKEVALPIVVLPTASLSLLQEFARITYGVDPTQYEVYDQAIDCGMPDGASFADLEGEVVTLKLL
eukprot:Phypoly_transcript_00017.p1 GENE.Phypoly_transcript_00017~~Phypoly_transcript_00017.p1  ORF type:complete len:3587 (+),score=621.73 Phypoly_transcript_00017:1211-10762(+)